MTPAQCSVFNPACYFTCCLHIVGWLGNSLKYSFHFSFRCIGILDSWVQKVDFYHAERGLAKALVSKPDAKLPSSLELKWRSPPSENSGTNGVCDVTLRIDTLCLTPKSEINKQHTDWLGLERVWSNPQRVLSTKLQTLQPVRRYCTHIEPNSVGPLHTQRILQLLNIPRKLYSFKPQEGYSHLRTPRTLQPLPPRELCNQYTTRECCNPEYDATL